jgi:hypothetical protein
MEVFVSAGSLPYDGKSDFATKDGSPYILFLPTSQEQYYGAVQCNPKCEFSIRLVDMPT